MPPKIFEHKEEISGSYKEMAVISARRPFVESKLRQRISQITNIELRHPVSVRGLVSRTIDGRPHVTGVVTDAGESIIADVVIDASGRRSAIDDWLSAIGARPPSFAMEPTNQLYFTRYYHLKSTEGLPPLNNGFATVQPFPWYVVLMFPGDNDTIQVAMGGLPEDTEMKKVRQEHNFQKMASMAPAVAPWVDPAQAEPVSGVSAMGGLNNHLRRLVVDGDPVVTGIHMVGDSGVITNPQYGRGISHAAAHAAHVARTVIAESGDPVKQSLIIDEEVERMLVPSFHTSIRTDRIRAGNWRTSLGMSAPSRHDVVLPEFPVDPMRALQVAASDPAVWYSLTRCALLLEPPGSWVSDPVVVDRVNGAELQALPAASLPTRQDVLDAFA